MIAAKVANALALDYPRELLEIIVASDGSTDATVERAREAGADLVLELPRGGKVAAQNAAAERADGRDPRLLRRQQRLGAGRAAHGWSSPSPTTAVGYVCGQVRFTDADGGNLEGAYWRYEMAVRELESALAGVTAGNGAIYAVAPRRLPAARPFRQPRPLASPSRLAKRGLRSLYAPGAPSRGEDGADASRASSPASGG